MTGLDFPCADLVFEGVIAVRLLDAKRCVGVARPAPAPIEAFINSPDPVFTADAQGRGVILSVTDVGKPDLPHDVRVECPRGPQSVDAQGVIAAVFFGPFPVIDETRRDFLQIGVHERVGTDDHGETALTEKVHDFLERTMAAVQVVGVKLYRVAPAVLGKQRFVPATADAQVASPGDDVLQGGDLAGEIAHDSGGSVRRVVVDDDDVEREVCLLREGALHGPGDGSFRFRTGMTMLASAGKG